MAQLHAVTVGRGPDLVLLHGWAMHSGVWGPLLDALAMRWRVTCVDLPGHGLSACPDDEGAVAGIADIEAVAPREAVWAGWSLGGLWALKFAERFPERVNGLALIASSPSFVRRDGWPVGMAPDLLESFSAGLECALDTTLRRFVALQFVGVCGMKQHVSELQHALAAHPPALCGLRAGLAALQGWDLREVFARLEAPSVGVFGALDRLVHPGVADAARGLNPRFHGEVVAGLGHTPFVSNPGVVAAAIERLRP